jgi:alkylation response protein AidB-like acyl-CoA dehydrogenase
LLRSAAHPLPDRFRSSTTSVDSRQIRSLTVTFEAATAEPLGAGGDASDQISRTVMRYQSALCAEAVGCMDEALRLTTDYLTTRKQFGVTLNNFQTLTQRAADMYVSLELARSMSL